MHFYVIIIIIIMSIGATVAGQDCELVCGLYLIRPNTNPFRPPLRSALYNNVQVALFTGPELSSSHLVNRSEWGFTSQMVGWEWLKKIYTEYAYWPTV